MAQDEKIFADGFSFKRQENAPDFVIGRVSIKVNDAITFLQQHEKNGWVNLNAKYGRSGNAYMELDTYEPKAQTENAEVKPKAVKKSEDDDLPF